MRFFCYSTIFKIPFLCTLPISFAQKTYDEPKMKKCLGWHFECCARRAPTLRKSAAHRIKEKTPQFKKCCLLRLPFLFSFLYLALFHRETTERRPRDNREKSDRTFLQNFADFSHKSCTCQKKSVPLWRKLSKIKIEIE